MARSRFVEWMEMCAVLLLYSAGLTHGAASFSEGPVVRGKHVGFVLSEPSDVEIAVIDSNGEIVRHLAAGVLGGKNPPPAPLKPGLKQILEWDGKDDKGKPAQGAPFSFRVRAGIKPTFDGFPLENRQGSHFLESIAIGPGGQLYCLTKHTTANNNMGGHNIKIYDRDGKAVRQLKPFAATIPQERIKAMDPFSDEEGRLVPRIHNWEQLNFYPDLMNARGRSVSGEALPAIVDSKGTFYWLASTHSQGVVLKAIDADGGSHFDDFMGENIISYEKSKQQLKANWVRVALSSDDQFMFATHFITGKYDNWHKPAGPLVFRIPIQKRGAGEVFIDGTEKPEGDPGKLVAPRGVATAKGLLYVTDIKENRVVVYSEKDASYVGEVEVESPDTIVVDPSSGAIYVVSKPGRDARLVKIDNYKSGKELYRSKFPKANGGQRIVLDASQDTVRLWCPQMSYGPTLTCIDDTGSGFKILDDPREQGTVAQGPRDLTVDRKRNELYVKAGGENWYRISTKTHKIIDRFNFGAKMGMPAYATQLVPCEDGSLVTLSYKFGTMRWTRDAKPLNWEGKDDNEGTWGGIMTFTQNYMDVHDDEIFFVPRGRYKDPPGKKIPYRFTSLNVMGFDREERRTAIWQLTRGSIPRVDAEGNIYIASMIRTPGRTWPEFFDGKLKPAGKKMGFSSDYWYSYMYGGIAKFPPEGGSIWFKEGEVPRTVIGEVPKEITEAPKIKFDYHYYYNPINTGYLQNAEWMRFGFAPYSETYPVGTPSCMCEGAGFDVDGWGRVFYPNLGQYRVEMIDNNNNFIGTFGHYGNEDSIGNGKAIDTAYQHESSERVHPDIPLAWPTYVACSDEHAYVNDTLSRRVVAVRLDAEVSETVPIK